MKKIYRKVAKPCSINDKLSASLQLTLLMTNLKRTMEAKLRRVRRNGSLAMPPNRKQLFLHYSVGNKYLFLLYKFKTWQQKK